MADVLDVFALGLAVK